MLKKKKTLISIVLVIIIFILATFIVSINRFFPKEMKYSENKFSLNTNMAGLNTNRVGGYITNKNNSCFSKYAPESNVIFLHSSYCPHCRRMMPIVRDLEKEGYGFYWAESSSKEITNVKECFSELISGYVPQFICPANKKSFIGETSKENLKRFADECKRAIN